MNDLGMKIPKKNIIPFSQGDIDKTSVPPLFRSVVLTVAQDTNSTASSPSSGFSSTKMILTSMTPGPSISPRA
jgi:hypothetical protein